MRRNCSRRHALAWAAAALAAPARAADADGQRWYRAALAMKALAEGAGDQPYGAALVLEGKLVGEGPSRVVQRQDPNAHAEREAIGDAQRRLGRANLAGAVLYSTSRPCAACEAAALDAGIRRLVHGAQLATIER